MKSDLLTGWGPHYAQEGDISMQRSGDDPEVLQMHSGFIQAAGLIQQGRVSHLRLLAGHSEDAKHGRLTSYDHYVLQVKLICSVRRPLPLCCVMYVLWTTCTVCALNGFYLLRGCCSYWCSFKLVIHQDCNYHCGGSNSKV